MKGSGTVHFRVLGPLQVLVEGRPAALGGAKQRLTLAALLLHANEVVSADRLAEILWGNVPPESALSTVQKYVYRLRGVIDPKRDTGGRRGALLTLAPGYFLRVAPDQLDAACFADLVSAAQRRAGDGDLAEAGVMLDEALGLWRGPAWAEFGDHDFVRADVTRLEGLRALARENRIEVGLSAGCHAELIGEIEAIVAEYPLRERPRAQLMVALYRSGRQAEALRAYQVFRNYMIEEIGLEPSSELQHLENAIVVRKTELDWTGNRDDNARLGVIGEPEPIQSVRVRRPREQVMPSGTVTFLITDIEGSTRMFRRLGRRYADVLNRQRELLRAAVAEHGGVEVNAEGDGLFFAFGSTASAIAACITGQGSLSEERWPDDIPVRVRMGLHTGEASPSNGDYVALAVHQTARVAAAAHGGQVLLSQVAAATVDNALELPAWVQDVGTYKLEDFDEKTELFQLCHPRLFPDFPPPRAQKEGSPPDIGEGSGRQVPLPSRLAVRSPFGFVGRSAERARFHRAWSAACAGRGRRVLLVSGEPGIGKTSLVAEAARAAHADAATVLYGRCDDDIRAPYQPFAEALTDLIACASDALLRAHVADHGGELVRIVPALAKRVASAPVTRPSEQESERALLFAAVAGLLHSAAQAAPVLLVLDDIHWADKPTLSLLRRLSAADRARLLVVATYRESELTRDHPLCDTLAALRREPDVEDLALDGLEDRDVVALVKDAVPPQLQGAMAGLAGALYRATDGNPFFTGELLRHLTESGELSRIGDPTWRTSTEVSSLGLPRSVRDVIGARVSHLGAACGRALTTAAVIGEEFDLDLLAAVTGYLPDELTDLLELALGAALLSEVTSSPGRFQFAHSLIQQTLYREQGETRRARTHHRVAECLESAIGDKPGRRAGELAHHFLSARRPDDAGKAIAYARAAGDAALDSLAPDEAVRWFERALEFFDTCSSQLGESAAFAIGSPDILRVELLLALGYALGHLGDWERQRATLSAAIAGARALGSAEHLARAVAPHFWSSPVGDTDPELAELCGEALAGLPDHRLALRSLVLLTLSRTVDGGDKEVDRLTHQALELARRSDDPDALLRAFWGRGSVLHRLGRVEEVLVMSEELSALALRQDSMLARVHSVVLRTLAHLTIGDLPAFDSDVAELGRVGNKVGGRYQGWALMNEAVRALLDGRFAVVEDLAVSALASGPHPDALNIYAAQLLILRREQGRIDEMLGLLERAVEENPGLMAYRAALALTAAELDRPEQARRHVQSLMTRSATVRTDAREVTWVGTLALLAEAVTRLGDARRASILELQLQRHSGLLVVVGWTAACLGAVDRYLGMLAAVQGHWDEAEQLYDKALALEKTMGSRPFLARTHLWHARMLRARARPGDSDRAKAELSASMVAAREVGMSGVEREVAIERGVDHDRA